VDIATRFKPSKLDRFSQFESLIRAEFEFDRD